MTNKEFLDTCVKMATDAGHIWPEYAACEAALESGWGKSKLTVEANNLFGRKQGKTPVYETYTIATKEYIGGQWITVEAKFVKYPDWMSSFKDRMETLRRLAPYYMEYQRALAATTGEEFIRQVRARWATDPESANKVLAIHAKHFGS